jgi:Flp pilus assembly protein TadD
MILIERNEDLDEAMEFAQLAVNAAPLNPSFLDTLAHVHAAQGDFDTAIEKLNRTVELDPDEPLWRQHLEEMRERKQESGIASARLSG